VGCDVIDAPACNTKDTTAVCVNAPDVPVTVILYVPGASAPMLLKLTVTGLPGTTDAGVKVTFVPAGTPEVAAKVIGVTYPPVLVVANVAVAVVAAHGTFVAAGAVRPKPTGGTVTVKFVLLISKKILPIDSILILAVVVAPTGITNDSEPSFGVLATRTVGKVRPPSVE
jgi:hypothetical protein